MIVKPTVKELLNHAENRYALVIAVSKRAREIAKNEKNMDEEKKPVTIAANELAEGKVIVVDKNKIVDKSEEIEEE